MSVPQIDRFQPTIDEFTSSLKKGYAAKGLAIVLFIFSLLIAVLGCLVGADSIVALAIAFAVLVAFLFHFLSVYIEESTVKQALASKQRIAALMEQAQPSAEEQGELYARLALSVRSTCARVLKTPQWCMWLVAPLNRLISYVLWRPLHILSEVLFMAAVDQHISRIKAAPTDLKCHAALANCYVMLANHYLEPMKTRPFMTWPGILLTHRTAAVLEAKGRASSHSAIEELSILSSFAPDQLWVHDQLAISYRELEMPEKEIEECEAIIKLCPDDHQALLRLGILYFRQGRHAKGLEVYERLKPIQPLLAEELIGHYGAYTPFTT
jgi:tetratricopeptide (TPR) repeat protein